MKKHTAGPWIANDKHSDSNYPWRVESDAGGYPNDGYIVAKLDGPDAEANARLIATAPGQLAEIEQLKERVEKWKTWHDSASEDAKNWRRDAQELQGVLNEIKLELQSRAIHLLSKHCWCSPEGHSWLQKGTVAE